MFKGCSEVSEEEAEGSSARSDGKRDQGGRGPNQKIIVHNEKSAQ